MNSEKCAKCFIFCIVKNVAKFCLSNKVITLSCYYSEQIGFQLYIIYVYSIYIYFVIVILKILKLIFLRLIYY